MPDNLNTVIIVVIVVAFLIARQFTEQTVRPQTLVIYPLLIGIYTYFEVTGELAKPIINPAFIIGAFVIGLLPGILLGLYRASLTRMRIDRSTGTMYAKPSTMNIILWIVMLAIKIVARVPEYTHYGQSSAVVTLLVAFTTTIFLGYVCANAVGMYWRMNKMQTPERPIPIQETKW